MTKKLLILQESRCRSNGSHGNKSFDSSLQIGLCNFENVRKTLNRLLIPDKQSTVIFIAFYLSSQYYLHL
jgi:hypothetical protein